MTIAEQILRAKADYDEVFKAGQLNVLNSSEVLKGNEIGRAVKIDDISPIEHTLNVKVSSKNLFDESYLKAGTNLNAVGGNVTYNDGVITYTKSTQASNRIQMILPKEWFKEGKQYTIKFDCSTTPNIIVGTADSISDTSSFNKLGRFDATNYGTFTATGLDKAYVNIFIYISSEMTTISHIQIEQGTTATEYTPYIADFSGVGVSRYGKNLLQFPYYNTTQTISGITYTVGEYGSLTIEGTATANATFNFILASYSSALSLKAGDYTFSIGTPNTTYTQFRLGTIDENGTIVVKADIKNAGVEEKTFNLEENTQVYINCIVGKGDTVPKTTFYPMIELGTTATAYEPYKEPQTAISNADGTVEGIDYLYPTLTLIIDTEGANIECQYYKDIDKAFNKLEAQIVSLGGELA